MKKGYFYIFCTTILFSTMEVALKGAGGKFNPIELTFLRFLIGALVLFPFAVRALRKRNETLIKRDYAFFALTGFICVVVSMTLYQASILYSQASIVAILFSCNPVFTVPFAFIFLKEKIYPYIVVSILLSLTGIMVIVSPEQMSGTGIGTTLALLAAMTFALYNVVGRTRSARYGGIVQTCFSFLFGSAEMFILIRLSHISAISEVLNRMGLADFAAVPILEGFSASLLPFLLFVGVGVTGLGYTFYFLAMEETSAATASIVFFIKPALAPILALIILGEAISLHKAVGMIFILCGSFISLLVGWKKTKEIRGGIDSMRNTTGTTS